MTSVPVARTSTAGTAPRDALTGTGTLLRFGLRRDRLRIPLWLGALVLGTLGSAGSFAQTYPSAADRQRIAETVDSPAGLAMSGPRHYLDDYTIGAMLGHQMIGFAGVLVGLMSVLMVVRHTRAEEESGRAELVRATVVGRHAQLAAALLLVVVVNVGLGLLLALGLGGLGQTGVGWGGSLLYGATHTAMGLVFAAVAVVTAQLTAHSRGASGLGLAVIGAAYALRSVGDVGEVGGDALSWLSPIGWAQRTYVYVDDRWWPLLLSLTVAAAVTAVGFGLSVRRDLGSGLRPPRPGRPAASGALARPLGFALRLHRGTLLAYAVGVSFLGALYGAILGDAEDLVEDVAGWEEAVAELGGASFTEAFAAMVMTVIAVVATLYGVVATLRARSEETSGRAEPLLSTGLSRTRWLGGHLIVALTGGTVLLLVAGVGFGAVGAATSEDGGLFLALTGAALAYAPALWVSVGVAVVLFGWLPRATAVAWTVPGYAFVVGYLGRVLRFPDGLERLSPFGHVPRLPAADLAWTPLLALTLTAAGLVAFGLAGFRRRDLETR